MTTIFLWSLPNAYVNHGNCKGRYSRILSPRSVNSFSFFFLIGLLLESFPKASNRSLTSTPSFCFCISKSNRWLAMLSLRKLKYSIWMELLACLTAGNKSSNFSLPFLKNTMLLLSLHSMCSSFNSSCQDTVEVVEWDTHPLQNMMMPMSSKMQE